MDVQKRAAQRRHLWRRGYHQRLTVDCQAVCQSQLSYYDEGVSFCIAAQVFHSYRELGYVSGGASVPPIGYGVYAVRRFEYSLVVNYNLVCRRQPGRYIPVGSSER